MGVTAGVLHNPPVAAAAPAVTLQAAYDNSAASPAAQIVLDATRGALRIRDNATPVGNLLEVQRNDGINMLSVAPDDVSIGRSGRRWGRLNQPDGVSKIGWEVWPDDYTISAAGGGNACFYVPAGRTITLNVPGGGGIGNDSAPGGMNFQHTVRFEDAGNLFASNLLINAAMQVECAARSGPLYLFLDQYNTYADGISTTCSQHNAIRAQPRWGPNINGGSITQTSVELLFCALTVDGTVGSSSITTASCLAIKGTTLIGGGTIGTYNGIDIVNVAGPSTIRGINSLMNNGEFIRHTGIAPSQFGGNVFFNGSTIVSLGSSGADRIELNRPSNGVLRMRGQGGTNNEGLDWDFDTVTPNDITVSSPTGAGIQWNLPRFTVGAQAADPTDNNFIVSAPPGRNTQLAGDAQHFLFSAAGNITINHVISSLASFRVNSPSPQSGTGSLTDVANLIIQGAGGAPATNRYGVLITSNPTGGTLNYALRVTVGASRFDGRVDINNGIALGGGAAATLGTIGGFGPTAAAQAQWLEVDIGGVAHWIPVWT